MNDYEYAFHQDVSEKKNIAHSASHRRNGSKTKYVSLPSDHLTKKEKEALNGPVKTIKMNAPMNWEDFKSLDFDLQEKYIQCLIDGYSASSADIAKMFGLARGSSVTSYISRNKLNVHFKKGGAAQNRTDESRKAWREFCEGPKGNDKTDEIVKKAIKTEPDDKPLIKTAFTALTWTQFSNLSTAQQREYLTYIRTTYRVGLSTIAEVMNVEKGTLYKQCETRGLGYILKGKTIPTEEDKQAFLEFYSQLDHKNEPKQYSVPLTSFSLSFNGVIVLDEVVDTVKRMMGSRSDTCALKGSLKISFEGE